MSTTQNHHTASSNSSTPQYSSPPTHYQGYPERAESRVEETDIIPGRIFWLPSEEELPQRTVRTIRGKGPIEEGIYSHPVLLISRPAEEGHTVHFHLITSLQGKTLDQLYYKPANLFHASRRSWFLPIAPTPDHPDANSKATRKRFPTLEIADGATLHYDSYVNIRNVYQIDWRYLKMYANPSHPSTSLYSLERESMVRMLAKSKSLTKYEPGMQFRRAAGSREIHPESMYMLTMDVS